MTWQPPHAVALSGKPVCFIISPWQNGKPKYRKYLKKAVQDCFDERLIPIASHGFYPQFLDDKDTDARNLGMQCGRALLQLVSCVRVYADYGITDGMRDEILSCATYKKKVEWIYIMPRGGSNGSRNRHSGRNKDQPVGTDGG